MTKTERVLVIAASGIVILMFLFKRRDLTGLLSELNPIQGGGDKIRSVTSFPKNNQFAGCKCASTQTDVINAGDYSAGGNVNGQPVLRSSPVIGVFSVVGG